MRQDWRGLAVCFCERSLRFAMRYRADELYYEPVTVLGYKGIFTNDRIISETIPEGFYQYEVRHDDECLGIPCEVAKRVIVNFWGTLLTRKKLIKTEMNGCQVIGENEWIESGRKEEINYYYL